MMAQPREGYSNTGTPKETEHQCSPNTPTAPAQAETSRKAAVQGHTCNGRKTLPAKSKTSSPEKNGPKPTRHYDQTAATERTTSTADTGQNGSPSSKSRKRRLAGCGPAEYAITASCLQNGASSSKQPTTTHDNTKRDNYDEGLRQRSNLKCTRPPHRSIRRALQTKTATHHPSTPHLARSQPHHRANILNLVLAMRPMRPQHESTRNQRHPLRRTLLHLGTRLPSSHPPRTQPPLGSRT